jgi:uncharacterized Zn finger protein (UPF0148 family)
MGKAKINRINGVKDADAVERMYCKAIGQSLIRKKGTIRCPECGKELLITLPFKEMNQTIEDHVQFHKNQQQSLVSIYSKSINVRLSLAHQSLNLVCNKNELGFYFK